VVAVPVALRISPRLALATAVVAVALPVGAARAFGGPDYRTDPPAPPVVTRDGVRETHAGQLPLLGVAWSASGSSTLVVDAGSPVGCTRAEVRVVSQDDDVVRIAAHGYLAAGAPPDSPCAGPVTVDLGTPLLYRRVVEEGTDHVLLLAGNR
jgi:hypothetical protein